jgi:hypothetical protein
VPRSHRGVDSALGAMERSLSYLRGLLSDCERITTDSWCTALCPALPLPEAWFCCTGLLSTTAVLRPREGVEMEVIRRFALPLWKLLSTDPDLFGAILTYYLGGFRNMGRAERWRLSRCTHLSQNERSRGARIGGSWRRRLDVWSQK